MSDSPATSSTTSTRSSTSEPRPTPAALALGLLALVHPYPSALNALLVVGLAQIAGAAPARASLLGLGMLGLQFAIGAANDWFDVERDAVSKPTKPIPAGLVTRPAAAAVALACAVGGLVAAAAAAPVTLPLAGAMLSAGLVYDAWLKPTVWGWLAFAVAFPLLPVYAWYGAVGALPPRSELLLPIAALAGPMLQLANGLVDVERDAATGVRGLAGRLGRQRAWLLLAALQVVINGLAWATLLLDTEQSVPGLLAVAVAGALALFGLYLSARDASWYREWGWRGQAAAVALLAIGWLVSIG